MRGLLLLLLSASSAAAAALALLGGVDRSVNLIEARHDGRPWTGVGGHPGSMLYRNNNLQRRLENETVGGYVNMYCRIWAHTSRLNSIMWFGGVGWGSDFLSDFFSGRGAGRVTDMGVLL